ncbi:MAG: hypothetical protein Q8O49_00170 [bacterium]|nr:hypothetical protein [bacterium]
MCCSIHDDARLLQQFPVMKGDIRNGNGPAITGITMDHSGSWKLLPGESQIPALSESEAWKKVGGNPHII